MIEKGRYAILYLDILGYKERIKEEGFLEMVHSFMNMTLNFMSQPIVKEIEKIKTKNIVKTLSFSDNIVIFSKIENEVDELNLLTNLLERLAMLELQIDGDLFIRGGATIGELEYNSELGYIQGQGIIEVVEIESKNAIFPRIVIGENKNISSILVGFDYDFDGVLILDYLYYFYCSLKRQGIESNVYFNNYREKIIKGLVSKHSQKYYYLANYFNDFCRKIDNEDLIIKNLKMKNYKDRR